MDHLTSANTYAVTKTEVYVWYVLTKPNYAHYIGAQEKFTPHVHEHVYITRVTLNCQIIDCYSYYMCIIYAKTTQRKQVIATYSK